SVEIRKGDLRHRGSFGCSQVRTRYAELFRLFRAIAERTDVVKHPVVSGGELVDGIRRKDMCLRNGDVTGVRREVLVAGKGTGRTKTRQAGRQILQGVVPAESDEHPVPGADFVVDTPVKLVVVKRLYRIREIVTSQAVGKCG